VFSWICSGLITPYLAVKMLPKDFGQKHHGADPYGSPFYRRLRGWIDLALEERWLIIAATASALVLALAGMKFVPQQFFPNSERPELILDMRLKEGSSFEAATEQVKRMEAVLKKDVRSSPPIRAPARRASTWRCRPSCRTPDTRSSSS
jgi:multidrug efflux pump subunit AcrB